MSDVLNVDETINLDQAITSPNGNHELRLQQDGNLVLNENGTVVWASGTNGQGVARATLQNDGNFVLYSENGTAVWSTETAGRGAGRLVMQNDRNVVLYVNDSAVWASNTNIPGYVEAVPAPEQPAEPERTVYTVEPGDTLSAIARRFYGDGNAYPKIAEANNIANPDLIHPGQQLVIP